MGGFGFLLYGGIMVFAASQWIQGWLEERRRD
jgi:hypothetical protein